jgi:hypothetical protein
MPTETAKEGLGTPKGDEGLLQTAKKRFARVQSAEALNRQLGIEDLKFKNGDQWPEQMRAQRTLEKRPCLTINKIKTFKNDPPKEWVTKKELNWLFI